MDWTKIKTKHYIGSGTTYTQRGYLATFVCLVAHLEKYPTEGQLKETFGKNYRKILEKFPLFSQEKAEKIAKKVLEDVDKIKHKKSINRDRQERYRETHKKDNALANPLYNATEKRRGEKRREDIYIGEQKTPFSEYVKMTQKQYDTLLKKYGKFYTEKAIFVLDTAIPDKKGKPYKDHYRAILRWAMDAAQKKFPVAQHQDGKKDESFNRAGLKKLSELTENIGK